MGFIFTYLSVTYIMIMFCCSSDFSAVIVMELSDFVYLM